MTPEQKHELFEAIDRLREARKHLQNALFCLFPPTPEEEIKLIMAIDKKIQEALNLV